MTATELRAILDEHAKWLAGACGSKADLRSADLRYADLKSADLRYADLRSADLRYADLKSADLRSADLRYADLRYADLRYADLRYADLRYADLKSADLRYANLRSADLRYASLRSAKIDRLAADRLLIVPETGSFEGWKKCRNGAIVRLLIPSDAKRSNATGRKCRAERATVLQVIGADEGISMHDGATRYTAGSTVTCDRWEEDRWVEGGGGIHFYLTRSEAEAHW